MTLPPASSSFRDHHALRLARHRARELGILPEFWERLCAGDLNTAMGRLALEEARARRRRTRAIAGCLKGAVALAALALFLRLGFL